MLRDVRYRIWAKLEFIPKWKRVEGKNPLVDSEEVDLLRKDENPAKYNAMFERRVIKGQCFTQPYLGTRECTASFRLVDLEKGTLNPPIDESRDLGIMLYDMDFESDVKTPPAMFFHAMMNRGVIIVPPKDSEEILR